MSLEKYSDTFYNLYDTFPQGKLFRISFDSTTNQMRIISSRRDCFDEIRDAFSSENLQAFFSKQYGYRKDPKLYQINAFGYFLPGLLFEVLDWIKLHYGDLSFIAMSPKCQAYIQDVLLPLKRIILQKGRFQISNVAEDSGKNTQLQKEGKQEFLFRDYQRSAIEAWIFKGLGRGLIEIPTSGGKSFIIANFIWNLFKNIDAKYKVLILVPNTQLVQQFYKDLLDYGYLQQQLAKFTGGMSKYDKKMNNINTARIIISNRQYIFSNKNLLPKVDVLICDEVHQCNADATKEFITSLDCSIKVGCSGTIPKDNYSRWQLLGMFSKVVYQEDVVDLQDQGYISKLKITTIEVVDREVQRDRNFLFHLDSLHKYCPDEFGNSDVLFNEAYTSELDFYEKNAQILYKPVIEYLNSLTENILILFDRIENGKNIFEIAKQIMLSKNVSYIDGQTPVDEREKVRGQFEKSGDNVLVGNVSILGTGINIKRLSHIVFLVNTKSYSRVIQSIGRALRLHQTKAEAHLVDVHYNFKYSNKHYEERLKMYRDIYGKKQPDEIIQISI